MKSAYNILNQVSCDSLQQTINQLRHERDSLQTLVGTPQKMNIPGHFTNSESMLGIVGIVVIGAIMITFIKGMFS